MRRTAFLAGLTVLALLTSCREREEEDVLVLEEEAPDTVVVAPYWEEEEPLTIEDIERGRLDAYQRDRLPVFAPGAEKHLPYVIARGAEHLSSSAGTRRGRGSGTRGSRGGARGRYSAREG